MEEAHGKMGKDKGSQRQILLHLPPEVILPGALMPAPMSPTKNDSSLGSSTSTVPSALPAFSHVNLTVPCKEGTVLLTLNY